MTTFVFKPEKLPAQLRQIPLGIRGENDVTRVVLDFSSWSAELGSGVVQLLLKRSGDTSPYPVVLTQSGTEAAWTVSSTDLAKKGELLAEWKYTVGTQVKKSFALRFVVLQDIGNAGSAPAPFEDWLEQLTAIAADAEGAALSIQDMGVEASTLAAGSAATVTKTVDPVTGAVTLSFGIPRGRDGAGAITVDTEMSDSSEDPVQNKVITAALAKKPDYPYQITMLTEHGNINSIGALDVDFALVDTYHRSRYMVKVKPGAKLEITGDWTTAPEVWVCVYNANGNFISGGRTKITGVYTVPTGVQYIKIRLVYASATKGDATLIFLSDKPMTVVKSPRIDSAKTTEQQSSNYGAENFFFETEPGYYTSARLILPPNYSVEGQAVPMFVYLHGTHDYWTFGQPNKDSYFINAKNYLRDEGFAVLDVYGWTSKYQDKWNVLTASVYPIPTVMNAYLQGMRYCLDRFNIDPDDVHLYCKSLGGEMACVFAGTPGLGFKTVFMNAPALAMGWAGTFGSNNVENAKVLAEEWGMTEDPLDYLGSRYGDLRSKAGRAFFDANKYALANINPGWLFEGATVEQKLEATQNREFTKYSGGARRAYYPVCVLAAMDDTEISFEFCAQYVSQLKNGGSETYFMVWPSGTGGHSSETAGTALKETVVTALDITVQNAPLTYIRMVEFARGKRNGTVFFDRGVNYAPDSYPLDTATGAVVNISDGADMAHLKELSVALPYSAVPYESVTLGRAGENKYSYAQIAPYHANEVVTPLDDGTGFEVSCSTSAKSRSAKYTTELLANHKLFVSADITVNSGTAKIALRKKTDPYTIYDVAVIDSNGHAVLSYQLPANVSDMWVNFFCTSTSVSETGDVEYRNVRIDYDRETEEVEFTDITAASDGEVTDCYGGTLDVVSGVLTITKDSEGNDLAAPVTHQLLPNDLSTVRGDNAIWADAGDVTLTYRADPTLYIEKKLAALGGGT